MPDLTEQVRKALSTKCGHELPVADVRWPQTIADCGICLPAAVAHALEAVISASRGYPSYYYDAQCQVDRRHDILMTIGLAALRESSDA